MANTPLLIPKSMSASAKPSPKVSTAEPDIFAITEAAIRRASRKVALENKRLGLPLIAAPATPLKRRRR